MTTTTEDPQVQAVPATPIERIRGALSADVVKATAEKHGVCVRPFTMEVGDTETGEVRYVPVPCGSTVESVCLPCARKAKALRQAQCREGWHLTEEPVITREKPSETQTELLTYRADLAAHYRDVVAAGDETEAEELRAEVAGVDAELRASGMTGRLPALDVPERKAVKRSTKRRQDAPNLPRRKVAKTTVGREFAGSSGRRCSSR